MTETELTDRLREAIVLDGPDVWRTNGYLQEAQQAGISLTDALKQANVISQEVSSNSLLFQNIQARIARLAQPSRSQFIEQDLQQIINAASSLKLSPDFVRNQWVPTVLHRLASANAPAPVEKPLPFEPVPVAAVPVAEPPQQDFTKRIEVEPPLTVDTHPSKPVATESTPEPLSTLAKPEPVEPAPARPSISLPEPPPVVRSFTATPARVHQGQPVTLAWEVDNLLAVTIDDLGEGLSPSNRGWVKPTKTTDYTLFDANDNPLSTVRVEVIPRDRSGVYGVLFAMVILALIYWFIKSSNSKDSTPKARHKTDQTTTIDAPNSEVALATQPETYTESQTSTASDTVASSSSNPPVAATDTPITDAKISQKSVDEEASSTKQETQPTTPGDARQGKYVEAFGNKPYDKVELGTDERGWRRARVNGRWGYINEADEWVINPEYEAVTPFRGNTASVFVNGQLLTINRSGEQIRN